MIQEAREQGIAFDMEEYLEGIRAFAVPLKLNRDNLVAAIWAVGLKDQIKDELIDSHAGFLKEIVRRVETRFALM